MRLTPLKSEELTLGRLVVSLTAETGHLMPGLRVIASLEPTSIAVATIAPRGAPVASEIIPISRAIVRLRVPLFERGDRVAIHGKKATIVRHSLNELFVGVTFDDDPTKEVLANLVHVNANDLFEELDPDRTQIYVR